MNITKQVLENINSLLFEVNLDENTNELPSFAVNQF